MEANLLVPSQNVICMVTDPKFFGHKHDQFTGLAILIGLIFVIKRLKCDIFYSTFIKRNLAILSAH